LTDSSRKLPFKLGRYNFRRTLGKGTQGAVYLAEMEAELGFRRKVAVKIVGEGTGGPERAIKSLANEARALAAAHHPNVVQVYDLARIDAEYLLVMEFVEGPTLGHAIHHAVDHGRTIGMADALLLGEHIAEGLSCVHSLSDHAGRPAPMVHRDLKPGNVILSRHGQTKLVDFGLAKGRLVAFHTVVPNITRGTPAYMSPEQVRGEELTPASDQFSFGTMLFEVITGHPLFRDANELAVMHRVMEGRPSADPELLRQTFPEAFPLIARCLAVDPTARHGSMSELAEALRTLRRRLGLVPDLRELAARVEEETGELSATPGPLMEADFIEPSFPDLELGDSLGEIVASSAFEDAPTMRAEAPRAPMTPPQLADMPSSSDQCFVVDEDAELRFSDPGKDPTPADMDELFAELPDLALPPSGQPLQPAQRGGLGGGLTAPTGGAPAGGGPLGGGPLGGGPPGGGPPGGIGGMGKGTEQFFFGDDPQAPSLPVDGPSTVEPPDGPDGPSTPSETEQFEFEDLRPSELIREALRDDGPSPLPPAGAPLAANPPTAPTRPEPLPPFDPRGPDRPPGGDGPAGKPKFKDLMSRDVSFHGVKPGGKRMSFTGPRPVLEPAFDRESLPDDEDSEDSFDSSNGIPPWEVD
jgi:eukaryotic-like serine/threonine-protein kinase